MGNFAEPRERSLGSPGHDQVLGALRRVLDSTDFIASDRNRRFLSYVVLETLAGRADRLKGYTVAVQVFGRDAAFDAQTHPLVRIEAGRLRQSLERYYLKSGSADPIRISIPKGGYVPVFERAAAAAAAPEDAPAAPEIRVKPLRRRAIAIVTAALAIPVAVAAALAISYSDERGVPARNPNAVVIGPSVVIQPFSNIDANAAEGQFSLGLTQELSAALARFKTIKVVAAKADGAADRGRPPYDYVVSGSVRRLDDTARVLVQLEDGASGAVLWTRLFDWSPSRPNALDAQYEIAAKVAATLGDPYDILFSNEVKRVRAVSSAAFDPYACVLRFNAYWGSPRPAEHRVLRDCHEKSVSEVPAYADAWANLAWLYLDEARFGYDATDGTGPALDRAADAAFHAASLQPDSARAQLAMAVVQSFRQDPRGFEKHAELALSLNENDTAVAAEIGLRYVLRGDWDRGRPLLERAIARDPVRWQAYRAAYALHALETGDYTTALEEIGRSRVAEHPGMKALRASIYGHLGRLSDAREAWQAATQAVPLLADAPRAWFTMRGVSDRLACSFVHGLDQAGVLDDQ